MAQVLRPTASTLARLALVGLVAVPRSAVTVGLVLARSDHATGRNRTVEQPVPFSHAHHGAEIGIDCRSCHASVEVSAKAGMPPTTTCMSCHSQLRTNAEMLAPVRESFATGVRLEEEPVNRLPDSVYFNHSVHVASGVWLHDLPRGRGRDAADAPTRLAHHGLVSRLPPRPGPEPAARGGDPRPVPAARQRARHRPRRDAAPLRLGASGPHGLLDVPPSSAPPPDLRPPGPDRREVLRMFSAGAAAPVAGCSPPEEEIIPHIAMPEGLGARPADVLRHGAAPRGRRAGRAGGEPRGPADQGPRQPAAPREPRRHGRLRRGRGARPLRPRPRPGSASRRSSSPRWVRTAGGRGC